MGMAMGSLDYGMEKISYYATANYMSQHFNMGSDMERTAGNQTIQRKGTNSLIGGNTGMTLGLIYDPNEYNDFNLNVSFNNSANKNNSDTWNYTGGDFKSIFKTVSQSETKNNGLTTSLFYKHKFDKKTQHGLEAEMNYFNSLNNNTNTHFRNTYFSPIDTTEQFSNNWQNELNDTKVQNLWGQTNYTLPFDSVYTFNIGVSANYNRYNTNNESSLIQAFNMEYSDLRAGGYAELSRNFKKGSLRIGSRFETSHVIINGATPSNYSSPLPYANGSFKINDANSLKLAYSKRVIRPSSGQLNPFVSVVDSQTISRGNMNLKPAYRDNIQLTYNTRLMVKKLTFNLSPQVFYENKTGLIQTILSKNPTTHLIESVPTNISNGYEAGCGLSLNSQIGKVMLNSNVRYTYNHIDRYLDQILPTNQNNWNWNTFVMFPLPKNFQFMAMAYINGPVLNGQMETKSTGFYMGGINKQFLTNHSVRLFAFNPFADNFFKNETTIKNSSIYQKQTMYMNRDYSFMVMYSYSFKIGKTIDKAKHSVEQQVQDNMLQMPINF